MLDVDSGSYFMLDDIAADIWTRLAAPTTAAAICADLQERYDVTPAACERDVMNFLRALHAKGLLRIVD